jgi:putative membrane protein
LLVTRPLAAALGMAVLAGAWLGPLPSLASRSFAAHMTLHVAVVAVAAPFVALGLAGGRLDPVRRWSAPFAPIPASLVELAVVWAWHTPVLHHAARHHVSALAAEQASFLLTALALWLSALGGSPIERAARAASGILALLLTSMHMTLLGALLALAPRPLYAHAHGASLPTLDDQHLGGAVMLLVGGVSYLAGGLALSVRLLRPATIPREARGDGARPAAAESRL